MKAFVYCLLMSPVGMAQPGFSPLADVYASPELKSGRVTLHAEVQLSYPGTAEYSVLAEVTDPTGVRVATGRALARTKSGRVDVTLPLVVPQPRAWSPDDPVLYRAQVSLADFRGLEAGRRTVTFGFRTFERRGNTLLFNGRPFFMRGFAGEYLVSGDHGCTTTDEAYIRKRIRTARDYGFNAERHHSHFPTETYLAIADELGLLQQLEIHGRLRKGVDSPEYEETRLTWERMTRLGRRHVSVAINSMGNEVYQNEPGLIEAMDRLYEIAKSMNPAALVLNRSGSLPGNDAAGRYDLIERPIGEYEHDGALAAAAFEAYLRGSRAGRASEFPMIAHEYPLASAYPRLDKAALYPSVPAWFRAAEEKARLGGYLDEMPRYARNSEAIQWRVIKQMIEAARSFPELAGYSMLRLNDTGSMVGGILDDFSNPKSVSAAEFRKVNGPAILLAKPGRRTFRPGDRFETSILLSQHDDQPMKGTLEWRLGEWARGERAIQTPGFGVFPGPTIAEVVPDVTAPKRLELQARLDSVANAWDFWVFPAVRNAAEQFAVLDPGNRLGSVTKLFPRARKVQAAPQDGLLLTDSWPDWMDSYLEAGGRLLLLSDKNWREPEEMGNHGTHLAFFTSRAPVALPELDEILTHWLTIPSNYDRRWGNSGTVIQPHPALGDFPHEGFCDSQFVSLIRRAKSFWLDRFPSRPQPIIRAIDNFWHGNSKAYLVEFRVGNGRVLATTLNFTQQLSKAPEADYLLLQLVRYALGSRFEPVASYSSEDLRRSRLAFAQELPALLKKIGDANLPPEKYRYNPLSGDMN